jgi:hypothetical protein
MRILAGAFLIAHGLIHLAIWVPRTKDAPLDVNHSPLFGDVAWHKASPRSLPIADPQLGRSSGGAGPHSKSAAVQCSRCASM